MTGVSTANTGASGTEPQLCLSGVSPNNNEILLWCGHLGMHESRFPLLFTGKKNLMLIEEFDIRLVRQAVCYDCVETIKWAEGQKGLLPKFAVIRRQNNSRAVANNAFF